jgi:hypothetical protein
MNDEAETRQYCVTVKIYTWALDEQDAIGNVIGDLNYLCSTESAIAGFIHPKLPDVMEDKEA